MSKAIGVDPIGKSRIGRFGRLQFRAHLRQHLVLRRGEIGGNAGQLRRIGIDRGTVKLRIFVFDLRFEGFDAGLVHQNFDARLVFVVAPSFEIIDAHHRFQIGQQFIQRQEIADHLADHRRAAQTAADRHFETMRARVGMPDHPQADIMRLDDRAVVAGPCHRNLELARQIAEFGMGGRPLADQFAHGTRINPFIGCNTRKMIGCDIADAIAAGLDAMHLDIGQQAENVRHIAQFRPVELDILPRGKMTIAAVITLADQRQLPQLL